MRTPTGLKLRRDHTAAERKAYNRAYQKLRRAKIRAQRREYYRRNPEVFRRGAKKYEAANRAKINARHARYVTAHPRQQMWSAAKYRAKQDGLPFTLRVEDIKIPKVCPVLGVPMVRGTRTAPSLDRRVPARGYTRDNVAVISRRANVIKHNATPAELRAVAAWVSQ